MPLEIVTVPCLSDNYAYLLHDSDSGATAVADVPEAAPVKAALDERGWTLTDIFVTHHHGDHIDGVDALRDAYGATVWGAKADARRLPKLDKALTPEATETFAGETVRVFDVSGHTVGHIAYYLEGSGILLTGDSLMACGCGRLFEGSAGQMNASLAQLADLPKDTIVCSGHEYTQKNARFAVTVDPDNAALADRLSRIEAARAEGRPTVPTTLEEESATNPFLRVHTSALQQAAGLPDGDPVAVFAQIRSMRDSF